MTVARRRVAAKRRPPNRWGGASPDKKNGGWLCWWYVDSKKVQKHARTEGEIAELKAKAERGAETSAPASLTWSDDDLASLRQLADGFDSRKSTCWHDALTSFERFVIKAAAGMNVAGILLMKEAIEATHKAASAARSFTDLTAMEEELEAIARETEDMERVEIEHTAASAPAPREAASPAPQA